MPMIRLAVIRSSSAVAQRRSALAALVSAAAVLAGCAQTSTPLSARERSVQSHNGNVSMRQCGNSCTGEIDGAKYAIQLPREWNGTLLLYSHGYRFATPAPPSNEAVDTSAQVSSTDTDGTGTDALSTTLLKQGYALAGSSYKSNGWAVADGVKAGEDLHARFVSIVGKPLRTYVWGDSLGGLITELLSEKHASDWVDGSAPMCGAVAGPILNFDLALDVAYAVKALIYPQLKLTSYASAQEAADNWTAAAAAVTKAAADTAGGGTAKVLFIAALADAPARTRTYDGSDLTSQVKARVESILTALSFGTSGRYELEQRVGGNPSGNANADYKARISAQERTLVTAVGGNVDQLLAALDSATPVTADTAAAKAFEALGDTTGSITVPTLTMHTEADPLVEVQNESVLAQRVRDKKASGRLVQLFIKAPPVYSESAGAPYGAGHCVFSDAQRVALIDTLDGWARMNVVPVPNGVAARFGDGLDAAFTPPAWPSGP